MRATVLNALFLFCFVVLAPSVYAQCDCVGHTSEIRGTRYASAYEELVASDSVFVGEVVDVKRVKKLPNSPKFSGSRDDELEIKFKVKQAWKRRLEESVIVRNATDGCLIGFEKGEEYLVYAVNDKAMLRTEFCSRTRLADNAMKDIKEFEAKGVQFAEIIRQPTPKP